MRLVKQMSYSSSLSNKVRLLLESYPSSTSPTASIWFLAVDRGYINPADLCRLHDRCQAFATAGLTYRLADLLPLNLSREALILTCAWLWSGWRVH